MTWRGLRLGRRTGSSLILGLEQFSRTALRPTWTNTILVFAPGGECDPGDGPRDGGWIMRFTRQRRRQRGLSLYQNIGMVEVANWQDSFVGANQFMIESADLMRPVILTETRRGMCSHLTWLGGDSSIGTADFGVMTNAMNMNVVWPSPLFHGYGYTNLNFFPVSDER